MSDPDESEIEQAAPGLDLPGVVDAALGGLLVASVAFALIVLLAALIGVLSGQGPVSGVSSFLGGIMAVLEAMYRVIFQ